MIEWLRCLLGFHRFDYRGREGTRIGMRCSSCGRLSVGVEVTFR